MNAFKLVSLIGLEYEYSFGISVYASMLVYVFDVSLCILKFSSIMGVTGR